ncbi:MAG: DUF1501 domain-containing protein, partial [bacterium]|nr:DUF1501 domain-containing protein [bacterium]
ASFLPAKFQGTRIGTDGRSLKTASVPNLNARQSASQQRRELDLVQQLNQAQRRGFDATNFQHQTSASPEVDGLIESFELGFRMQSELPQVMNIDAESEATQEAYGIGNPTTEDFGRKCLLARRLVESGVRFVEITHGNWDQHFNLKAALEENCTSIDRPAAALLADLQARGMLDETLVIWSGEFGRTPHAQNGNGRDHNHEAFSCWMAGGGIKPGVNYGQSDEYGYQVVEKPVSIHDWHATILHLLGLDHERLTYRYAGRDFRLTDVYGEVIEEIIG